MGKIKKLNLDRHIIELKKYVDDNLIFTDKISGKNMILKEYQMLRKVVQSSNVVYITSLDILGWNKEQIKQELEYFKKEGVRIKVLDIQTTTIDIPEWQ